MDSLTCGICLDQLTVPVSTPCGHLCCEACLTSYIETSEDAMSASCPTCRAPFPIATPDLRFVPKKYHTLILPSIRRVFIADSSENPAQQPSPSNSNPNPIATNTNRELRVQIAALTDQVSALVHDKTLLMDRCEAALRARDAHAQGERDCRLGNERLERDLKELRRKYECLKSKYRSLKASQENTVPLGLGNSLLAPSMTTTGKRKSSQAALDLLPNVSSSSSSSSSASSGSDALSRDFLDHYHPLDLDDHPTGARPMLRIQKRPRLLGSPFDLTKRIVSRATRRNPPLPPLPPVNHSQLRKKRSRMLIDEDEEGDSGFRASDFDLSLGSSLGPQRSGLPRGDVFSPREMRGGQGSICFGLGEGDGSMRVERSIGGGSGVRPTWLLSPEDE